MDQPSHNPYTPAISTSEICVISISWQRKYTINYFEMCKINQPIRRNYDIDFEFATDVLIGDII